MKQIILVILLFHSTSILVHAQKNNFFKPDDRVCFVGNSITDNGEFHHNILLYHLTRFPYQQHNLFNCGVSGDVAQSILNRMDKDILIHNPTKAVIMIGMNDIKGSLYGPKPTFNADTLRFRQEDIETYKVNLEKIINKFISNNVSVILQKPSIYDETGELKANVNFGKNAALKSCADIMEVLAIKYNLETVDYWTIMTKLNSEIQKKNPKTTLTSQDRVHPGSTGHFVMAYQFLKAEKAPRFVSKIIISRNQKKSSLKSENCEIKSVLYDKNKITFIVKENSLPFPIVAEQEEALTLVPFVNEFNNHLLKVTGLKASIYKLKIDGILINSFTKTQFETGINMANHPNTPQYIQSMCVRDKLWELRSEVAKLRAMKYIEYNAKFQNCPNKEDLSIIKVYMDSVFSTGFYKINPYYKAQLNRYLENKPLENDIIIKTNNLRLEAVKLAQPIEHIFTIEQ